MERSTEIPLKEKASVQRKEIVDQLLAIGDSCTSCSFEQIQREEAQGVVVFLDWPAQGWYLKALGMLKQEPIYLKARRDLLRLPSHPEEVHPIWHNLNLLVGLLSGKVLLNTIYHQVRKMSLWPLGERVLLSSTVHT